MANVLNLGGSGANVQSKTVKSSQTTQTITPEEGVDGFNPIIVNPFLVQSKTVSPSTSQQVVKPDTGKDGLSQVTVIGDSNLVAGNIKSGVRIFGVDGSYSADDVICVKAERAYGATQGINATFHYSQAINNYSDYSLISFYVNYSGRDAVTGAIVSYMAFNAYTSIFGYTGIVPIGSQNTRDVYLSAINCNIAGTYVTITPYMEYMNVTMKTSDNVLWGSTGSYIMWAWFAKNAKLIS